MKQLFYLSLLLISLSGTSQNKFIEVEVSDTITLQPKSFEYLIMVGDSPQQDEEWDENYSFDQKAYNKRIIKNKDKIENLLKAKKYNYMPSAGNTIYPPLSAINTTGFAVTLNNKEELLNLKELISKYDFVNSYISYVEYLNEERSEGELLKKLLDKANSKAALIATYSDLKLGKIIEVIEGKEPESLSLNIHDTYFVSESKNFSEETLTGTLYKILIVKFAAQ